MEEADIRRIVIDSVVEIQMLSGREVGQLNDDTRPIKGVLGFDSLNALEAKHLIEERLKHDLESGLNPFVSADGRRALSVREIVNRLKGAIG